MAHLLTRDIVGRGGDSASLGKGKPKGTRTGIAMGIGMGPMGIAIGIGVAMGMVVAMGRVALEPSFDLVTTVRCHNIIIIRKGERWTPLVTILS